MHSGRHEITYYVCAMKRWDDGMSCVGSAVIEEWTLDDGCTLRQVEDDQGGKTVLVYDEGRRHDMDCLRRVVLHGAAALTGVGIALSAAVI